MYQNILFDLDGTVTDSAPGILHSIRYAMERMGREIPAGTDMNVFIGPPLKVAFVHVCGFSEPDADRALSYYREYYSDAGLYECRVYPGISELLAKLDREGRFCALATAKPEVFSRRILDHFGLTDSFSLIAGASLDGTRPDKKAVLAYALQRLPEPATGRTVMIGDRDQDALGAKAFGLPCIGVLYGYGSAEELSAAGADVLVRDTGELECLLMG